MKIQQESSELLRRLRYMLNKKRRFRLKNVQTSEELRDVHTHFLLYYSNDLPEMQKVQRAKERKREVEEKK